MSRAAVDFATFQTGIGPTMPRSGSSSSEASPRGSSRSRSRSPSRQFEGSSGAEEPEPRRRRRLDASSSESDVEVDTPAAEGEEGEHCLARPALRLSLPCRRGEARRWPRRPAQRHRGRGHRVRGGPAHQDDPQRRPHPGLPQEGSGAWLLGEAEPPGHGVPILAEPRAERGAGTADPQGDQGVPHPQDRGGVRRGAARPGGARLPGYRATGLHESISAHGKALRDFEQTRLYGEDGAALAEFRFVRADAFAADEVEQDEEIRLARYIAADACKAARTIIRTRKAARANEAKLSKALGLVSQAEGLAGQAKAFAAAAAGLSWDTMQVLGQSDLALSATRRSLVETRFTERLRSRLKGELADRAARRKRDESNALVIADFDKYIGEESRTTTKIGQVRTALTPRHWLPVPPLYQWSGGALRGRCTLWRLQDLRPQRPRLQGPRLQGSRAGQELRGRLRPFPGEAA